MFILHSHDYNAELGNIPHLQSFEEKFPQEFQDFERGFIKFMHYVEELESGIIVEEPKRQSVKTFIELNTIIVDIRYCLVPTPIQRRTGWSTRNCCYEVSLPPTIVSAFIFVTIGIAF